MGALLGSLAKRGEHAGGGNCKLCPYDWYCFQYTLLSQVSSIEQLEQLSLLASSVPTLKAFEQALADALAQPSS